MIYNHFGEVADKDYLSLLMLNIVDTDIARQHIICPRCDTIIRKSLICNHKLSSPNCVIRKKLLKKPRRPKKIIKDNVNILVSFD